MTRFAVRVPDAVAVMVTLITHDAPAASEETQVLALELMAKSEGSAPVNVAPLMLRAVEPLLVSVVLRGADVTSRV